MARWRQAVELAMKDGDIETLTALSRSRTEPTSRVSRAAMLLAYREPPSFFGKHPVRAAVRRRARGERVSISRAGVRRAGFAASRQSLKEHRRAKLANRRR